MELIDHRLLEYCEQHSEKESALLAELNRQTHLKALNPRMLSGHLQGRFLAMISRLLNPRYILEIGTYTGYSALCLAEGLQPEGELFTIDPNEETNSFAQQYFDRSPYKSQIRLLPGQAAQIIPTLDKKWDLIFIDADKKSYSRYLDLVADRIKPGGLVIADNVLWSGKVIAEEKDADTVAIRAFNKKASADERFTSLMLPLRDGLMVLRKK